jgi:hypothetical protein
MAHVHYYHVHYYKVIMTGERRACAPPYGRGYPAIAANGKPVAARVVHPKLRTAIG